MLVFVFYFIYIENQFLSTQFSIFVLLYNNTNNLFVAQIDCLYLSFFTYKPYFSQIYTLYLSCFTYKPCIAQIDILLVSYSLQQDIQTKK